MPFRIVRDDIVNRKVEVIVNAANYQLKAGNGVDAAIHKAAGPELDKACDAIGHCEIGEVVKTPGFNLDCNWIFHTVGPIWKNGVQGEEDKLKSCYKKCLEMLVAENCKSIAFPLISAGAYGYPVQEAIIVAVSEIWRFLFGHSDLDVELVVYDEKAFSEIKKLCFEIEDCLQVDNQTVTIKARNLVEEEANQHKFITGYSFNDLINRYSERKELVDKQARSGLTSDNFYYLQKKKNIVKLDILRMSIWLELTFEEVLQLLETAGVDKDIFTGLEEIYINHIKKCEWDIRKWEDL